MTTKESDEIRASLIEFGFQGVVIVNQHPKRKDIIVGGHQRCMLWRELGNSTVPCMYVHLTEEKEKELNLRLNKAQGHFDFEILTDNFDPGLLRNVGFENIEFFADRGHDIERQERAPGEKNFETSFTTEKAADETVAITVGTIKCRIPRQHFDKWLGQQMKVTNGKPLARHVLDLLGLAEPEETP